MIDMKVSHEEELDFLRINDIEIRQLLNAFSPRVNADIEHNLASFTLEVDARATDFASRAKWHDLQQLSTLSLDLVDSEFLDRLDCLSLDSESRRPDSESIPSKL